MPSPSRSIQAIRELDWSWKVTVRCPIQASGTITWSTRMVPEGSRKSGSAPAGSDPAQHLVGGPLHGRHRRDAEPLVDLGAAGVVDPGHDLLDAEGLAGDPRGDDVGVVTAGHGRERVRPADAGLLQHRLVEAVAGHPVAVEARPEPAEGVGLAVDDRHRVVPVLEAACEGRADPAAAHDHDVHERTVSQPGHLPAPSGPLAHGPPDPGSTLVPRGRRRRFEADPARGASCAAPSSGRPCSPSASRCRSSPATRSRRWPTHPTRSS